MSKLIYAKSKAGFESAFADKSTIDKSIAFIEDGYIWTHGKYFKMFPSSNGTDFLIADVSGATVTLKDGVGNTVVSFSRGVASITGQEKINATTSNGATTVSLNTIASADTTVGPTASGTETITIPQITFDKFGLYKSVINRTATLNHVLQTAQTGNTNYYILGSSASTTNTSSTNKSSNIFFNPSTGLLTATSFSENGTTLVDKYAPKSHTTVAATGSVLGHVTLSDSLNSTSGVGGGVAATPAAIKAIYDYAQGIVSSNDAMLFKGVVIADGKIEGQEDVNGKTFPTLDNYKIGWTFRASVAQEISGIGVLEVGDMIIAMNDKGSSYSSDDFTVIQTNIDGAVTSASTLTADQVVVGGGNRALKILAAGTNGRVLTMVSGKPAWATIPTATYREIKVDGTSRLASNVLDAIDFVSGTGISLSYSSGKLTIDTSLQNLTIQDGGTALGNYNPTGTTNHTINVSGGIKAALSSNVFTLSHTNSVSAQGTAAVRSFSYDAHGHVTGSTIVDSLKNPNSLTFNGATNLAYDGSAARTIAFAGGTDVSVTGAVTSGTMTYTTSITHRYRPISFRATEGAANTVVFSNSSNGTLVLSGGTNTSLTNSSGVIKIDSINTWRDVKAVNLSGTNITALASLDQKSLTFGNEFIWANDELKLGWAEVATNGTITYAV